MKNFLKIVLRNFSLILIFFLFSSCAFKAPFKTPYQSLIEEGFSGRLVKGKIFIKGEFFFLKNNFSGGSYGDFVASYDILYLYLKPPFSSEIIIIWKRGEDFIKVINKERKKVYKITYEGIGRADFSSYFLGLKERKIYIKKGFLEAEYEFLPEELEGKFTSPLFNFSWKIKNLEFSTEIPTIPDQKGFKEKEIEISL